VSAKPTDKPTTRRQVNVRVKTRRTGVKRARGGVIFTNEWKHLRLDDKGSAYRAIAADPLLLMEIVPEAPPEAPKASKAQAKAATHQEDKA